MAEMIIQNPSITPNVFEYDEAGRVSAISGYPLAGGGGGTIVKSDLMWKPSVENDGFVHWTLASSATTPAPAYISGAQGPAGPQGVSGNPGKNPEFQINSENAHWEWRYSGDAGWTDLGVVASGAVGPQGLSGNSGKDGISPKVRINNSTNFWEISEDDGKTWTSTNVSATGPAGEDGTNGTNGISPTVSTSAIPGGNRVIFTYDNGGTTATESIDVMSGASGANGSDGFSPTVVTAAIPVSDQFPAGGTKVTITDSDGPHIFDISNGLDGQGATVNLLGGEGIEVTKVASNYTIAVSADYAAKSYVDSASANALSEAKTWVGGQGYLTSVPDDYALKSDVPTTVAQLSDSGNYYKKTETSGATEITNALNTKLDSTAAAQTYQTKSDMANYLTTSDASTIYQPKGDYATTADISGMATQTWVGQQGYLTSIPDSYATKTYANEASANAYDKAVAQIPNVSNFITKDVDDLTYYYKKTETSGATELSTEFAKYVTKPDTSLVNKYLVLRTDNAGNVSGWCDFNVQCYSKSEADRTFVATANIDTITLSGNGKSSSTKLGVNTEVIPTIDWLDDNYLPLSGGTVSGSTYFSAANGQNMLAVASAATLIGASRQTSGHFGQDTNALGTTWIGVGGPGMYRGFLKYTQGGNVGDLDSNNTMQVEFTPSNKGQIFAKAKNSGTDCPETQILNPTKTSCDAMTQSANANLVSGPNYMLAKNADGQFVIGAACVNCTAINDVTLTPNTYYFVYEV